MRRENVINIESYLRGKLPYEQDVTIPYSDEVNAPVFHRDALVLMVMSELLVGESALLPMSVGYQDLQRLTPAAFPLIFTYVEEREANRFRLWRLR